MKNGCIALRLIVLVLSTVITFWGTFFLTLIIINAIPIHGLDLSVPAIFSALISGLVSIYIAKEVKN